MSIHYTELRLANYIQEKSGAPLDKLCRRFAKSVGSLRRAVASVNAYLPKEKRFIIEKDRVSSALTYTDYIEFIGGLTLSDYAPSQEERVAVMLVRAFFDEALNMSRLYESMQLSLTTKKKDSKALAARLKRYGLTMEIMPKRGVRIVGDERGFRLAVLSVLRDLMELGPDDEFTARLANTPVERMLYDQFAARAEGRLRVNAPRVDAFLTGKGLRLSYPCKKFLHLYLAISGYRSARGFPLAAPRPPKLALRRYHLLDDAAESEFLDHLLASFDYAAGAQLPLPADARLEEAAADFIASVQENIITKLHDEDKVLREIYDYLYKCVLRNHYGYCFYDNKLDDTKRHIAKLYATLTKLLPPIEAAYQHAFSDLQIAALTLIFKRMIDENKVVGRNKKRVVVVTNSSAEKIAFFIARLKSFVDITLTDSIHINELDRLQGETYDALITFSNRISTLLAARGCDAVKLNFYLTREDIDRLFSLGFSSAKRKLPASRLIDEIAGKTKAETKAFLLKHYPEYFL